MFVRHPNENITGSRRTTQTVYDSVKGPYVSGVAAGFDNTNETP